MLTRREQQPTVVLLRDGTDTSQGIPQLLSNISACMSVANVVATTLGPRGMDKLIVDANVRPLSGPLPSIRRLENLELTSVPPARTSLIL